MSWSFSVSFRFNSSFLFIALGAFVSTLLSCSFSSSFQFVHFVTSILSFKFFLPICYFFPFISTLTSRFKQNLKKMQFARKAILFKFSRMGPFGLVFAVQAATCGHSSGYKRPLKWLQIMQIAASDAALEISNPSSRATGHLRPFEWRWLLLVAFLNFKYCRVYNLNAQTRFRTEKLSHTKGSSYPKKSLYRVVFTHENFYTQKLLHKKIFAQRRLYTK